MTFKIADQINAADLSKRLGLKPPTLRAKRYADRITIELRAFVYDRDQPQDAHAPRPLVAETTAEAAALAAGEPDWRYDLDANVGEAFAYFASEIVAALPSDRALDTSWLMPDGNHIRSWRSRLASDLVQTIAWQIGHADEAESLAADELAAAYRHHDGTEIGRARIEAAETSVRQTEARAVHWRAAHAATLRSLKDGEYPLTMPSSGFGVADRLTVAIRTFQNALGSPDLAFLAHRTLWGLVRIADRGIASVQRRWKKAQANRDAARDCRAQLRAYDHIRTTAAEAYAAATGDRIAFRAGWTSDEATDPVELQIARWIDEDRSRARAFAQ